MGHEDQREDKISELVSILEDESTVQEELVMSYEVMKAMCLEKQKQYWDILSSKFNNFEEGHCYDIVDRLTRFDFEHTYITESQLSKLLLLDDKLKQYCLNHIKHDGIIGVLKYKAPLLKKDVLRKALDLID